MRLASKKLLVPIICCVLLTFIVPLRFLNQRPKMFGASHLGLYDVVRLVKQVCDEQVFEGNEESFLSDLRGAVLAMEAVAGSVDFCYSSSKKEKQIKTQSTYFLSSIFFEFLNYKIFASVDVSTKIVCYSVFVPEKPPPKFFL